MQRRQRLLLDRLAIGIVEKKVCGTVTGIVPIPIGSQLSTGVPAPAATSVRSMPETRLAVPWFCDPSQPPLSTSHRLSRSVFASTAAAMSISTTMPSCCPIFRAPFRPPRRARDC
jgi:hypothetical protein